MINFKLKNFISDSLGLDARAKEEILATVSENPLQQLQEEFSSTYKIGRRVESSDFYIAPVTVKLPAKKNGEIPTCQMVPLTKVGTCYSCTTWIPISLAESRPSA